MEKASTLQEQERELECDLDALNLSRDMPGLGKEDVRVSPEQNTLVIKGKVVKEDGDEESARRYTRKIELPEKIFKTDQIKAEMKNGVLKLTLPKMKEDERTYVLLSRLSEELGSLLADLRVLRYG